MIMSLALNKKLTLASKSKIRAAVLRGAGFDFDIVVSGVDEDAIKNGFKGDADALALALADAKAKAVVVASDLALTLSCIWFILCKLVATGLSFIHCCHGLMVPRLVLRDWG